ncbi:hypothetical protein HZS_6099 [Henneguya salminicola]|nr:hypothetical protein HZS_6099 [Henneguya salminicola]
MFKSHAKLPCLILRRLYQCIWRRIQIGGQSILYWDNERARSIFKIFAAIAFIQGDNRTSELLGGPFHRKIALRHHFLENGISRTNSKVEGWHNAFASLVGRNHQNIFKFLASLQRELSLVDSKLIL